MAFRVPATSVITSTYITNTLVEGDAITIVNRAGGYRFRTKSGLYYRAYPSDASSLIATVLNELSLAPLYLGRTTTFDQALVTSFGLALATFRAGIYDDSGDGFPGALHTEIGVFDTSTAGDKTIALALTLNPGLYWIGGASQAAAANLNCCSSPFGQPGMGRTDPNVSAAFGGFLLAGVAGALPANFGAGATEKANVPVVALRAA